MDKDIALDRRTASSALGLAALLAPFVISSTTRAAENKSAAMPAEGAGSKNVKVRTPDGVTVSIFEYGNPSGQPIVMVHGFAQCHLSWLQQVNDGALTKDFRMIAYDFRGHGDSDKLMDPSLYNNGDRFADEFSAVMDATEVQKPIVVGWSYGTRIVGDYLIKYGTARLAGLNLVGVAMSANPKFFGPGSSSWPNRCPTISRRAFRGRESSCAPASPNSRCRTISRRCSTSTRWCRRRSSNGCDAPHLTKRR